MPATCFSYQADVPPGIGNRNAAQPALPGLGGIGYPCFSYPSGPCFSYPSGPCFSYPANVPRRMPLSCFSYSAEVPPGARNRNTVPGQRRMPVLPCFSY
jgi:hypothetical protein